MTFVLNIYHLMIDRDGTLKSFAFHHGSFGLY